MTLMNMINTDNSRKILFHHKHQRHLRSIVFGGAGQLRIILQFLIFHLTI